MYLRVSHGPGPTPGMPLRPGPQRPLRNGCLIACVYHGPEEVFDDGAGHQLRRDVPLPICDETARGLAELDEPILVTPPTWFHDGGGCCRR